MRRARRSRLPRAPRTATRWARLRAPGVRTWGARGLLAAGFGFLWIGPAGAALGLASAPAAAFVWARRLRSQRAARIDDALPSFVDSVAAAMRAGASLPLAVRDAHGGTEIDEHVVAFARRLDAGARVEDALDALSDDLGTPTAHLVCSALAIGHRSGGDLPRMLDVLALAARDRRRAEREARVASAQARMSAWVVAALPVVFLFLTGAASREQTRLLFRTPVGWALLAAGGTLEAAGIAWMRRLAR